MVINLTRVQWVSLIHPPPFSLMFFLNEKTYLDISEIVILSICDKCNMYFHISDSNIIETLCVDYECCMLCYVFCICEKGLPSSYPL